MLVLLLAVPLALFWMITTGDFSITRFIVGYAIGIGVLVIVRTNTSFDEDDVEVNLARIPSQILWLIIYTGRLAWDTFISGAGVARRVLTPSIPIDPNVIRITTQDSENDSLVSALSAHSITITPSEMVIDFETNEQGDTVMLIHSLDKNVSTREKLEREQKERLVLIRRILGKDTDIEE
ncbi:MAG: Na+/H+ antiporter subunit E [Chloroflexota bacterium]